eukprot:7229107-Alexandrium_andersonii.AAC.1
MGLHFGVRHFGWYWIQGFGNSAHRVSVRLALRTSVSAPRCWMQAPQAACAQITGPASRTEGPAWAMVLSIWQ